jgi:hypothetical protein
MARSPVSALRRSMLRTIFTTCAAPRPQHRHSTAAVPWAVAGWVAKRQTLERGAGRGAESSWRVAAERGRRRGAEAPTASLFSAMKSRSPTLSSLSASSFPCAASSSSTRGDEGWEIEVGPWNGAGCCCCLWWCWSERLLGCGHWLCSASFSSYRAFTRANPAFILLHCNHNLPP